MPIRNSFYFFNVLCEIGLGDTSHVSRIFTDDIKLWNIVYIDLVNAVLNECKENMYSVYSLCIYNS